MSNSIVDDFAATSGLVAFKLPSRGARILKRGKKRLKRWFLKGPIPGDWIARAALLPGKGLATALYCWHVSALSKGKPARLTHKQLSEFSVSRWAAARALQHLEQAGLITVDRKKGRSPLVAIIQADLVDNDEVVGVGDAKRSA